MRPEDEEELGQEGEMSREDEIRLFNEKDEIPSYMVELKQLLELPREVTIKEIEDSERQINKTIHNILSSPDSPNDVKLNFINEV